jgi:hypothetical protein
VIDRAEHDRRLEKLRQVPAVRSYWEFLEAMEMPPAFGMDGAGRIHLHGLTAAETLEILQLHAAIYGDGTPTPAELERHRQLRLTHDAGMKQVFAEHRARKISGAPKH